MLRVSCGCLIALLLVKKSQRRSPARGSVLSQVKVNRPFNTVGLSCVVLDRLRSCERDESPRLFRRAAFIHQQADPL